MASKQTYPCFACRKAGYEIPVYLDGKDEQGRTKYLYKDGTRHIHKTARAYSDENHTQKTSSFHVSEESVKNLLVTINEKLDRLLNLAELKNNKK